MSDATSKDATEGVANEATGYRPSFDEVSEYYTSREAQEAASQIIGARIKQYMKERNLTQEQVAKVLELGNKSSVNHLLQGRTRLGIFQLMALSKLLKIDERELLHGRQVDIGNPDDLANNAELARQYIKSTMKRLSDDRVFKITMQVAKKIGARKASEAEIMEEVNDVIAEQLEGVSERGKSSEES